MINFFKNRTQEEADKFLKESGIGGCVVREAYNEVYRRGPKIRSRGRKRDYKKMSTKIWNESR